VKTREINNKISKIILDNAIIVEVTMPHASRLTPHASRLTPHASRRTTDNTDQTCEVFKTSQVFTPSHNFTRRGAWHAPAVQYCSPTVFSFLPSKPVQSDVERGRIDETGMGHISAPFFRFDTVERRFFVSSLHNKREVV